MFSIIECDKIQEFSKKLTIEQHNHLTEILKRTDDIKKLDFELCKEIYLSNEEYLINFRNFLWNVIVKC